VRTEARAAGVVDVIDVVIDVGDARMRMLCRWSPAGPRRRT